jgi:hypothetical protein
MQRKTTLLGIVTQAMGKPAITSAEPVAEDEIDEEELAA